MESHRRENLLQIEIKEVLWNAWELGYKPMGFCQRGGGREHSRLEQYKEK